MTADTHQTDAGGAGPGYKPAERSAGAPGEDPERIISRKVTQSQLALFVERMWPRLWLALTPILLFIVISLAGLWSEMSPLLHKGVLGVLGAILFAGVIMLLRLRWPGRAEAIARLEHTSDVSHRPISSYEDTPTNLGGGSNGKRIWAAHRSWLARRFARLSVREPRPNVSRFDPIALRSLPIILIPLLLLIAGDGTRDRLAAAFRLTPPVIPTSVRLDAWVTPPLYTRKPPAMLANGVETTRADGRAVHETSSVEVPEGSVLIVRASGDGHEFYQARAVLDDGAAGSPGSSDGGKKSGPGPKEGDGKGSLLAKSKERSKGKVTEYRLTLKASQTVHLLVSGRAQKSWHFKVTPDNPPEIELTKQPIATGRGALKLTYRASDDYGVSSAEVRMELDKSLLASEPLFAYRPLLAHKPAAATPGEKHLKGPLGKPPVVTLKLPRRKSKKGEATTIKDLMAHPWAGFKVHMTLYATDQAKQTGKSRTRLIKLPARNFTKPMAKAVIELRRALVLAPQRHEIVSEALDAITLAGEAFIPDKVVYLGLRSVYWRLRHDPKLETIESSVAQLWEIALRIEDGDLSDAERALRAAQKKLMDALKNKASDSEIKRLMKELRQAMSRYLQSLARQAQKLPPGATPPNLSQSLSPKDIDRMLRQIENLARSGARKQAQQLLSQLQDLMNQMRSGKVARGDARRAREMMNMLQKFNDLIQRQQRLMDETFRADKRGAGRPGARRPGEGRRLGERGKEGERGRGRGRRPGEGRGTGRGDGTGGLGPLARRQGDIRRELGRLLRGMGRLGARTPKEFGRAGRAMEGARRDLNKGEAGSASSRQAEALDQLRRGLKSMAESIFRGMAQNGPGRRPGNRDPLGRPGPTRGPDLGNTVKVPDEIDVQRAREILEELRRRLSDPRRPTIELDYIERLLERF